MPPSAISGTPVPSSAAATSATAVICGTPTPATIRVVQMEPGPTPTFTPSAPGRDQRPRRLRRDDVAADDLQLRVLLLDGADPVEHALGVAVGGVDDQQVDARLDQRLDALGRVAARADGGADAQRAPVVLAGVGIVLGLLEVLGGDHAAQLEVLGDHQHLLDAVLVQEVQHFLLVGALADRHEPALRRHHGRDRRVEARLEAQVPVGDDADGAALVHHRHAGDVVGVGDRQHLADGLVRADGDGIVDDAALVLLDLGHLAGLVGGAHVLVDDAHAAFLGEGDRQAGLGDRVHGGGQDRDVQRDAAGHAGSRG